MAKAKYLHYAADYPRAACGAIAYNATMLSTENVTCPRCRKSLDLKTETPKEKEESREA